MGCLWRSGRHQGAILTPQSTWQRMAWRWSCVLALWTSSWVWRRWHSLRPWRSVATTSPLISLNMWRPAGEGQCRELFINGTVRAKWWKMKRVKGCKMSVILQMEVMCGQAAVRAIARHLFGFVFMTCLIQLPFLSVKELNVVYKLIRPSFKDQYLARIPYNSFVLSSFLWCKKK